MEAVCYERRDLLGIITLNRGENRNSMTPELLDAFEVAVERARDDEGIRCVIITGRGECFSAGADFRSEVQRGASGLPHERSYAMYAPFLKVLDIEVPVIGALNGHAVGGGFGLALLCDLRVANRQAKYGANFARLGLHPGMGVSVLLPRLIGVSRASELLYTGRLVRGDEAERIGLVSDAVPGEEVLERAMGIAGEIAENAPIALRLTKRTLRASLDRDIVEGAKAEACLQAATLETADAAEGVAALLEKRGPRFSGR